MPGRSRYTPIEDQPGALLWFVICCPPIFFAFFLALLCVSNCTESGWSCAIKYMVAVLLCWTLPWIAAVGPLEELGRRTYVRNMRPWLWAAITTTFLETVATGGFLTLYFVAL